VRDIDDVAIERALAGQGVTYDQLMSVIFWRH
jgi:hypothetical protein